MQPGNKSSATERMARAGSARSAFTMVEIALSIAVVSFALVAILGVLPTGLTVQKDNREDTLINQEGRYWMQLIRSGSQGFWDATNYIEYIAITNLTKAALTRVYTNDPALPLTSTEVISLLTTQKYQEGWTNQVTALVRAITGPAAEKGGRTNDATFRYLMEVETVPSYPVPPEFALTRSRREAWYAAHLAENLWDIRLVLHWPVVERGKGWFIGDNKKTFHSRVAGTMAIETNNISALLRGRTNLVLMPNRFTTNVYNGL